MSDWRDVLRTFYIFAVLGIVAAIICVGLLTMWFSNNLRMG